MAANGPHICSRCGERVSMFAAGCSICGAELDPHRVDRPRIRPRSLHRWRGWHPPGLRVRRQG